MQQPLITAATLARQIDRQPASIRTAVWRNGHFCGLKPARLPNGRLLWPADAVARITGQMAQ